jgi:magnesium chelatase subunit I
MVFSANPEDYTNRGNIITPLKDRIASQILTHYPASMEAAQRITDQEAWTDRGLPFRMPAWFREIVEQVAFEARHSEFVDQKSGVSARLSIAAYENLISNLERRWLTTGDPVIWPRIIDLQALVPAVSGKIELVYEGEQQGPDAVARHVVGQAVKTVFHKHFPKTTRETRRKRPSGPGSSGSRPGGAGSLTSGAGSAGGEAAAGRPAPSDDYDRITNWFSGGNRIEISESMPAALYAAELHRVSGLEELARRFLPVEDPDELPAVMELVLEGLYQSSFVAKETVERSTFYSDMLMRMFQGLGDD